MRPHLTHPKKNARGVSVIEILLVVAMISVVAGFLLVSFVRGTRSTDRTSTAMEIATCLQKARLDSMHRNARDLKQMAQVKIFNRRFYSIAVDGDNDGNLDVPLVKSLPEQLGVEIEGPFPKTYIFDWFGQTVDAQNHHVAPQSIVVRNSVGASAIRFDGEGKVVVGSTVQIASSK